MDIPQIKTATYGIFPMDAPVDEVVSSLNAAGFQSLDICVFLSPTHPLTDEVRTLKSGTRALSDEAGGEHLATWLATFGGVVIPGVGLFGGSREFLTALTCGLCQPDASGHGPLTNLGIPAPAAERYAARLLVDATLIFVACDGSAQSEWAREILRLLRAEEVDAVPEFERETCAPEHPGSAWMV